MTDLRRMSVFRDVQVAMDFKKMAEEGYLDTEFAMYGCVYWEDGQRHYIISSKEAEIMDFMVQCSSVHRQPSPLHSLRIVRPVALGEQEQIAREVKVQLAQELQQQYPAAFFQVFQQLAQQPPDEQAKEVLTALCHQIADTFCEESLQLVEQLILLAYESKHLSDSSYADFTAWLQAERHNMCEDVRPKDLLQKTFYTLMYETAPGVYRYVTNARKEWAQQKKWRLEAEGRLVAPIYSRTYWYHNQISLEALQAQHRENYEKQLSADYFQLVKQIIGCPSVFEPAVFVKIQQEIEQQFGSQAAEMVRFYGRKWQIRSEDGQ